MGWWQAVAVVNATNHSAAGWLHVASKRAGRGAGYLSGDVGLTLLPRTNTLTNQDKTKGKANHASYH